MRDVLVIEAKRHLIKKGRLEKMHGRRRGK